MASMIERHARAQQLEARAALDRLVANLWLAGIRLPSPSVEQCSPYTGIVLVELGRAPADVVVEIADLISEGLAFRAQQQS